MKPILIKWEKLKTEMQFNLFAGSGTKALFSSPKKSYRLHRLNDWDLRLIPKNLGKAKLHGLLYLAATYFVEATLFLFCGCLINLLGCSSCQTVKWGGFKSQNRFRQWYILIVLWFPEEFPYDQVKCRFPASCISIRPSPRSVQSVWAQATQFHASTHTDFIKTN